MSAIRQCGLIPSLLLAFACSETAPTTPIRRLTLEPGVRLAADATIRYLPIEGGCWAVDVAGTRYEPVNLGSSFQVDGLRVRVVLHEEPGLMSVCMFGQIVTLDSIARRASALPRR